MQDIIDQGLAIIVACLLVAVAASALIVYRPWKRRHRHRRRHSRRPKIDLFEAARSEAAPDRDA